MGPSWYWMPDVYDSFYQLFGNITADFYELKKLDPGFAVVFGNNEVIVEGRLLTVRNDVCRARSGGLYTMAHRWWHHTICRAAIL